MVWRWSFRCFRRLASTDSMEWFLRALLLKQGQRKKQKIGELLCCHSPKTQTVFLVVDQRRSICLLWPLLIISPTNFRERINNIVIIKKTKQNKKMHIIYNRTPLSPHSQKGCKHRPSSALHTPHTLQPKISPFVVWLNLSVCGTTTWCTHVWQSFLAGALAFSRSLSSWCCWLGKRTTHIYQTTNTTLKFLQPINYFLKTWPCVGILSPAVSSKACPVMWGVRWNLFMKQEGKWAWSIDEELPLLCFFFVLTKKGREKGVTGSQSLGTHLEYYLEMGNSFVGSLPCNTLPQHYSKWIYVTFFCIFLSS